MAGRSDADLPAQSVFILRRVCAAECSNADLHRSLEAAPQRQMLYEMTGRSQRGNRAPFQILWCGHREEHSTWVQRVPCLFWHEAAVIALRHDSRKLKPREREREITVIIPFLTFWFLCFEILFLSVCTNFNKVEIIDWSKLPVKQKSITSLTTMVWHFSMRDEFVQLLSLAVSSFHWGKISSGKIRRQSNSKLFFASLQFAAALG